MSAPLAFAHFMYGSSYVPQRTPPKAKPTTRLPHKRASQGGPTHSPFFERTSSASAFPLSSPSLKVGALPPEPTRKRMRADRPCTPSKRQPAFPLPTPPPSSPSATCTTDKARPRKRISTTKSSTTDSAPAAASTPTMSKRKRSKSESVPASTTSSTNTDTSDNAIRPATKRQRRQSASASPTAPKSKRWPPRPAVVTSTQFPAPKPSDFALVKRESPPTPATLDGIQCRTEDFGEHEPLNLTWRLCLRVFWSEPVLVQKFVSHDPWRIVVVTMMLNKTTARLALPVFWDLMERWPTAHEMQHAPLVKLVSMLSGLGLQNIRAKRLIDLSRAYVACPPDSRVLYPSKSVSKLAETGLAPQFYDHPYPPTAISHLPGAGRYALDSYRIFCVDDEWRHCHPRDKELVRYMEWKWACEGKRWCPRRGLLGPLDDQGRLEVIERCNPAMSDDIVLPVDAVVRSS